MACPLRSILVVCSALLALFCLFSTAWKSQSPRIDTKPASCRVRLLPCKYCAACCLPRAYNRVLISSVSVHATGGQLQTQ